MYNIIKSIFLMYKYIKSLLCNIGDNEIIDRILLNALHRSSYDIVSFDDIN